ncbi:flagellar motor protein MotB [Leptothrix discophora]|uniref:Flagellar motor protein MotB n=1 Tax=Leptothrix discophora TaxID=89 RepID=A0ABT9G6C9_LEPDI|nr:flagellar motor protein MotB [Leptothrix discophora]MDP4302032.1 flagellar motor protein MotB [Leptothrix discophora]
MAGDAKKLQPIIVKKIKKGGHGAHGGAWKIAYADFVTAMMAFFLLMWLLGSTSEGDKKGIQDYFQNPLKVAMGGGSGSGDATSIIKGGGTDLTRQGGQVKNGDVESERRHAMQTLKTAQAKAERERLETLSQKMSDVIDASAKLSSFKNQIRLDMTRDGLRIQIVDEQNRPMFQSGDASVQPHMREILRAIGAVLTEVPNKLTLEGHTDAKPFGAGERGYSNWELSSDRANASRRELLAGGLDESRVLRVQGLAASVPFDSKDTLNPINRRISIIVMTREAEDRFFQGGDAPAPEPAEPEQAPLVGPPRVVPEHSRAQQSSR